MLYLEMYKILKRKLVWIALAGLFLLCILYSYGTYPDFDNYHALQKQIAYYEKFKGELTDERITEFWRGYEPILFGYDYMEQFFEDGEQIPVDELYPDRQFGIQFGYFELWSFFLIQMAECMKFIPIFIVIAFSPLFTYEKERGMQEILLSTRKGRRECTKAKVKVAFLMANIVYVLHFFTFFIPLLILTKGKGWDTSIQMTPWLRTCQVDMNYLTLTLHMIVLSWLAVNVILIITLYSSFLVQSPMVAMCISFGILFIWRPDVMGTYFDNTLVSRITAITPLNIIDAVNLVAQVPLTVGGRKIHWLGIAEALYSVLAVGGGLFFFQVLARHQKYYAS